ncbi:unnamed protein product [Microthlaspi erraticum]|uniref:Uncharacterized protein n=1 Tax=Microthlaspi erraticum TaxID=1685480 RepID=A0A6D2JZ69_9BRAS|nr:unnamed protein product [Microthlaspi erraticum]
MSMGSDSTWVGTKPIRRIGGLSDSLSIASDLGYAVAPPPSQEELQNLASSNGDSIRVLGELSADEKNVAHLTHASEMQKMIETLSRMTQILNNVIQNKDRVIARLQQPYSLDCIPVEAEYQKQFSELLMKAASDYGALTASVSDFQWSQNFKEPPSVWGEMLRPIPVALASCTRFFEAMSAMRESFATLRDLRVGNSASSSSSPGGNEMTQKKKKMVIAMRMVKLTGDYLGLRRLIRVAFDQVVLLLLEVILSLVYQ